MSKQTVLRPIAGWFALAMLLVAAFAAAHFASPSQISTAIDHGRIVSGCPSVDAHCFGTRL
jgi:hypothetical protein